MNLRFGIMVLGHANSGKSTLINVLSTCLTNLKNKGIN